MDSLPPLYNRHCINSAPPTLPPLSWTKIVWHRHHLPRFALILWMAFWERLPTLDKLFQWGIVENNTCLLCESHQEDQGHLFFSCSYSKQVWLSILTTLNCRTFTFSWEQIQDWILNSRWSSTFQKDLVFLALSIVVYSIWRERNQRFHKRIKKNIQTTTNETLQNIRLCVYSWRKVRKSHTNWEIALNLSLPMKIFSP